MATRTANLNLRVASADRALIARAAEARGKPVTSFVLDAAIEEAQQVLLDQRFLRVSPEIFDELVEMTREPSRPVPELVDLFRKTRAT